METNPSPETKINVRALITAFENKSTNPEKPFSRPRARSLGNVLKNVIVKINEYKTLNDIQSVLDNVEQRLNQYKIYNKEKHVKFQEELFNILTSIINIENADVDQAKNLISKTKIFLSLLNNMLPNYTVTQSNIGHIKNEENNIKTVKENFQVDKNNNNKNYDKENEEIPVKKVSVLHLRNIFEVKSKENSNGLSLLLKEEEKEEKLPMNRFTYKTNLDIDDRSNGLLEILKKEKQSNGFFYDLNDEELIPDDDGSIVSEKSEDSLNSIDSVKSVDSIKNVTNVFLSLTKVEDN